MRALSVDEELSPLVRRSFSIETPPTTLSDSSKNSRSELKVSPLTGGALHLGHEHEEERDASAPSSHGATSEPHLLQGEQSVLVTEYRATTNRMLRVAVNGFFESIGVIISCMRELDEDVVQDAWIGEGEKDVDELIKVQGLQEAGVLNA